MSIELRVGAAIIVEKDNLILLGQRQHAHGDGTWAPPGGHLEANETPHECAKRELFEETGLIQDQFKNDFWTFDYFPEVNRNYITIFIKTTYPGGEVALKEPEKCKAWDWFSWDELPRPLFKPFEQYLMLR